MRDLRNLATSKLMARKLSPGNNYLRQAGIFKERIDDVAVQEAALII